jgi:hypothetical protein
MTVQSTHPYGRYPYFVPPPRPQSPRAIALGLGLLVAGLAVAPEARAELAVWGGSLSFEGPVRACAKLADYALLVGPVGLAGLYSASTADPVVLYGRAGATPHVVAAVRVGLPYWPSALTGAVTLVDGAGPHFGMSAAAGELRVSGTLSVEVAAPAVLHLRGAP